MYQAYILINEVGRTYIGVSADLGARLVQHNTGLSKWTRGKGPWALTWTSRMMTLGEARKLEVRLSGRREVQVWRNSRTLALRMKMRGG